MLKVWPRRGFCLPCVALVGHRQGQSQASLTVLLCRDVIHLLKLIWNPEKKFHKYTLLTFHPVTGTGVLYIVLIISVMLSPSKPFRTSPPSVVSSANVKFHDGISSVHSAWSVVSLISVVSINNTLSRSILIDNGEPLLLKRHVERAHSFRTNCTRDKREKQAFFSIISTPYICVKQKHTSSPKTQSPYLHVNSCTLTSCCSFRG